MTDKGSIELPFLLVGGVASAVLVVVNWLELADAGAARVIAWAAAITIGIRVWQKFLKPLAGIPNRLDRIEEHLGIGAKES